MNVEVLGLKPSDGKTRPQIQSRWPTAPGNLNCPSYVTTPGVWSRQLVYNAAAPGVSGGKSIDRTNPVIPDGLVTVPPVAMYAPDVTWPQLSPPIITSYYFLGAKLERFGSRQFLVRESDGGGDYVHETKWASTTCTMDPPPAHTAESGSFSFRHGGWTRANFLFFDGHVELLGIKDDINSGIRYSMDP